MQKNNIFSEEYLNLDENTSANCGEEKKSSISKSDEIEIDVEKYGVNKPRRIIIRGNLNHE